MNNRRINNSKQKGSITVFLSIILFTIVSFIFVLIDATRVYAANNQFIVASNNAARSAMSNYNANLFNEYGLFAYEGSGAQSIAEDVFNKNLSQDAGSASGILALDGSVSISPSDALFGDNDTFKKQMIYAMKYQGTENLAINVYERLVGLISASEQAAINDDMSEIDKEMKDLADELEKVEQAKLNCQKALIALVCADNNPNFNKLDLYKKVTHFDPFIGSDAVLKMINDSNIAKYYFNQNNNDDNEDPGAIKDYNYIRNPVQNIYLFKYTIELVNSYKRSYIKEYEKVKKEYDAALQKYNEDLAKYNIDKPIYDKLWEEYWIALDEYNNYLDELEYYNENKDKPGFTGTEPTEVEKPEKPTMKKPEKPEKPEMPEILKEDIAVYKKKLDSFNSKLNEYINNWLNQYFNNTTQYMGYYEQVLNDGLTAVGDLLNTSKREAILAKVNQLEADLSSSTMNDGAKDEIKQYISKAKRVLDSTYLSNLQMDLSNAKAILINYRSNFRDAAGSVIKEIDKEISNSKTEIPLDNNDVKSFIDSIKAQCNDNGFVDSLGGGMSASLLVTSKVYTNQALRNCSQLANFRSKLITLHDNLKVVESIKGSGIDKDNLDVGERNPPDKTADEVGGKLEEAKDNNDDSSKLKEILEKLNSQAEITELFFGAGAMPTDKAATEIKELSAYKDAFSSESYDESLLDKIYLTEYIMTMFKDLVDYGEYETQDNRTPEETEHDAKLEYEIEAILRGKYNDQENKDSMKSWVKAFRISCNMITILSTKKMRDFTDKAATSICLALAAGLGLIPGAGAAAAAVVKSKPFIKVVQVGLMIGWANMESNLDAADIFRGYYVPLIKKSDEWLMDLGLDLGGDEDGVVSDIGGALDNMDGPENDGKSAYNEQPAENEGLLDSVCYTDILRARLLIKLLTSEDKIISATKEVVNANMKEVTGDFDYNSYYGGMSVSANSSVNIWFKSSAFSDSNKVSFKQFNFIKRYN